MTTFQQDQERRRKSRTPAVEYPSGDGKPKAETQIHIQNLIETIQALGDHFTAEPNVYVCGNMLLYYVEGDPRKHISPDVLVTVGIPKLPFRDYYLVWKEGKAPDFVVEITSKSTRHEDMKKKMELYREVLKVSEYFLFDPTEDYLDPPLQGFRLVRGKYVSIKPVAGRLPSRIVGLHLERDGNKLRFFHPATGKRLLTRLEGLEEERHRAKAAESERQRLAEENERLRHQLEALRRGKAT